MFREIQASSDNDSFIFRLNDYMQIDWKIKVLKYYGLFEILKAAKWRTAIW